MWRVGRVPGRARADLCAPGSHPPGGRLGEREPDGRERMQGRWGGGAWRVGTGPQATARRVAPSPVQALHRWGGVRF